MEQLFLIVMHMSLTASYVIVFIMFIRLLLKKAPKFISYLLWSVAAFRLICPISFESIFSLLPHGFAQPSVSGNIVWLHDMPLVGNSLAGSYADQVLLAPVATNSVNPMQVVIWLGARLWLVGMGVMLCYSIVSILLVKRKLKHSRHVVKNVYETERFITPFVFGIVRPVIYIPAGLSEEERSYILRHEETHIRRYDYIVKLFAFILLGIHWFNPMVWIAFLLMSTDMELSCDEKVIREMGSDIRKAYSTSLLALATGKHILNGSPLAFGEGNVKNRIKNVLRYRKQSFFIILSAVIVATITGAGLLMNPKVKAEPQKIDRNLDVINISNKEEDQPQGDGEKTDLEAGVRAAVILKNSDQYPGSEVVTEAHTILKTVEYGDTVTVYAMALYMKFNYSENGLQETGGSHMPVAITFQKNAAGEYELKDYWTPQDGSYYAPSIKKRFPADISEDAIDTQKYVLAETQSCYSQAVEYKHIDTDEIIESLVNTICSSPTEASDPQAYIDAHSIEYREMIFYGSATLRYSFALFEQGGQTGLKGHILAFACRDLLGEEGAGLTVSTGQDWYNAFKDSAMKLQRDKSDEYLKEKKPGTWLLLQMLKEE